MIVLCSPNDERKPWASGAANDPEAKCKTSKRNRREEKMLREVYKSDPNQIAEALCVQHPHYDQAVQDYKNIVHSQPIAEWLSFLIQPDRRQEIWEDGIKDVIALTLEKKEGESETLFENYIQQLSIHLLHRIKGYEMDEALYILNQNPEKIEDEGYLKAKALSLHSSAKFHTNTSSSPLSLLGECCLSRHLVSDYRIIQTMLLGAKGNSSSEEYVLTPLSDVHSSLKLACKWGNDKQQEACRADLMSILSRRARYLSETSSCISLITKDNHDDGGNIRNLTFNQSI